MIPALSNKINALPPLVGSFGINIVSPFLKSAGFLILSEYTAIGSKWTPPIDTNCKLFSFANVSIYGICWKKFASNSPEATNLFGWT